MNRNPTDSSVLCKNLAPPIIFFVLPPRRQTSVSSVGDLLETDGNMNIEKYPQSLIHQVSSSGKLLIFQPNIDPKHSVSAVKTHLDRTNTQ